MARFNRSDEPPPGGRRLWIRRLGANEWVDVVVLSESTWGMYIHWQSGKSQPCWAPKKTCPGCRSMAPQKWRCWLHVWNGDKKREEFLEMTEEGWKDLMAKLETGQELRGTVMNVKRIGHKRGPLELTLRAPYKGQKKLPKARSPEETLCAWWGIPYQQTPDAPEFEGRSLFDLASTKPNDN